jgi:multisubunit Na+/H+ antiporter MnhE subunit
VRNAGKFAAILGVTLPASYLFWLILVGTFSLHELLIGIIAAGLTAAGMLVVTVNYPAPFPTPGSSWRSPRKMFWE